MRGLPTLIFMVLAVFLVVLQTTALHLLPGSVGRPDLTFLLVAFVAYRFAWIPGIVISFLAGWSLDVLAGVNLGVYPLECLTVFCCLKLVTTNSPVKEAAYQIPLVGVSYVLIEMLVHLLSFFTTPEAVAPWSWLRVVQKTIVLVIAAIPCFLLFNALFEFLQRRARRSKPTRRRVQKPL